MKIQAVIFDFFGVISAEVAPRWFQRYFSPAEAKKLKEHYAGDFDRGEINKDQLLAALSEVVHKPPKQIADELAQLVQVNQEVVELIKKLKPNCKLALCTNGGTSFIRPILEAHGLVKLFDTIVISSEHGVVKPERRIYEIVLSELGVRPDQAVFIDDQPGNVEGAAVVGLTGILFINLGDLESRLAQLGLLVSSAR